MPEGNPMKSQDYLKQIDYVESVPVKTHYQINAVLSDGEKVVLKKKSNKQPSAVQLYSYPVNGNAYGLPGQFFAFAKSVDSWYRDKHLKTYQVRQHV